MHLSFHILEQRSQACRVSSRVLAIAILPLIFAFGDRLHGSINQAAILLCTVAVYKGFCQSLTQVTSRELMRGLHKMVNTTQCCMVAATSRRTLYQNIPSAWGIEPWKDGWAGEGAAPRVWRPFNLAGDAACCCKCCSCSIWRSTCDCNAAFCSVQVSLFSKQTTIRIF